MSVLYIVPTPIGNLGDITPRAVETLSNVSFVAAEDTRVTLRLLTHLGIKKSLICYQEHNKLTRGGDIVSRILAGESCALVTDAGTPAISDPGEMLVRQCADAGITVVSLPGPCAAICALAASGLPTGRFCFEGFLSMNKKSRREHLASLKDEHRTMIFYEAPHKLRSTLDDLYAAFGDRRITLCRELTKIHEEFIRTTLSKAGELYAELPPRGEYVLVLEGSTETEEVKDVSFDLSGSSKEAAARAREKGLSRNEAYRASLRAKKEGSEE